jgi:hypothetical protein
MTKGKFQIHNHDIYKLVDVHSAIKNDYVYNWIESRDWLSPVYYHFDVERESDLNIIKDLMNMENIRWTQLHTIQSLDHE